VRRCYATRIIEGGVDMAEIGCFSDGIPKSVKEQWPYQHNGQTFTFGKNRESAKHFVYYCQRDPSCEGFTGSSSTGFETDRDLARAEVEKLKLFIDFMNASK
jgi:hypothetical protein